MIYERLSDISRKLGTDGGVVEVPSGAWLNKEGEYELTEVALVGVIGLFGEKRRRYIPAPTCIAVTDLEDKVYAFRSDSLARLITTPEELMKDFLNAVRQGRVDISR